MKVLEPWLLCTAISCLHFAARNLSSSQRHSCLLTGPSNSNPSVLAWNSWQALQNIKNSLNIFFLEHPLVIWRPTKSKFLYQPQQIQTLQVPLL